VPIHLGRLVLLFFGSEERANSHLSVGLALIELEVCAWCLLAQCRGEGVAALLSPLVLVAGAFELDDLVDHCGIVWDDCFVCRGGSYGEGKY
jgi:hypothetical protein